MSWINAAILSPAVTGIASTLSSHILSRRVPSLQSYLLAGGSVALVYSALSFYFFPFPEGIGLWVVLTGIVSGLLRATGVTFMLHTMRREEVSQIIAVVFTYPVFVAAMAVPLLGETLSSTQWLAIIIVVAGAIMVSIKKSPSGSATWLGKILLLLFGISLLFALADISGKYALAYISSWNMFVLSSLGISIVWCAVAIRPHVFAELKGIRRRSTIALILLTETVAPSGMVLLFWAMERGPVSLVAAIAGTRPIFVAIYTIVLSRLAPQSLIWSGGKGVWAIRLVAIVMIVSGISIIYLS